MVKQVVKFNLISNEIVEVKFGQTLGQIEKFDSTITLKKGASITKAELILASDQTYLSGANLSVTMNRQYLSPPLRWHAFESVKRSVTYDVTRLVVVGLNTYSVLYSTAYGTAGDQRANVNLDLVLTLEVADASAPGAGATPAKEDVNWTDKITETLKTSGKLILAATVVTAVVIGGVYVAKSSAPGKMASILRKFGG